MSRRAARSSAGSENSTNAGSASVQRADAAPLRCPALRRSAAATPDIDGDENVPLAAEDVIAEPLGLGHRGERERFVDAPRVERRAGRVEEPQANHLCAMLATLPCA